MPADVKRLVTVKERAQARLARDALEALAPVRAMLPSGALADVTGGLQTVVERGDPGRSGWRFVMVPPEAALRIWEDIEKLPARSHRRLVDRLFKQVLCNIGWNTNQVLKSRSQLAALCRCTPHEITQAMSHLRRMQVIYTKREREDGVRGPGKVVYFVNPRAAWYGREDARLEAEAEAPELLRLMEAPAEPARSAKPSLKLVGGSS